MHPGIIRSFFAPQGCLYRRRGPYRHREAGRLGQHYLNLLVAIVGLLYLQALRRHHNGSRTLSFKQILALLHLSQLYQKSKFERNGLHSCY